MLAGRSLCKEAHAKKKEAHAKKHEPRSNCQEERAKKGPKKPAPRSMRRSTGQEAGAKKHVLRRTS